MIVIDQFDKRLYLAPLCNPFLSHSSGDFARITFDSSNKGMAKRVSFVSLVIGFEDDCFAACVTTSGHESDFAWFQD